MKKLNLFWLSWKNLNRNKFFFIIRILITAIFTLIFFEILILDRLFPLQHKVYILLTIFSLLFFLCFLIISGLNIKLRFLEIGLLKSFGAKKGHIFILLVSESLIVSIFGSVIGIIAWILLYRYINLIFPLVIKDKVVFLFAGFYSILAVVALSLISSLFHSARGSFLKPYVILKQTK